MTPDEVQDVLRRLKEAERKIKELEDWKKRREAKQLTYPLDSQSQRIIQDIV